MSEVDGARPSGAWNRARELARRTPETRNRYVDLLRAVSILAVVVGHWLIAAPSIRDGTLRLDVMLGVSPWTQWLTWGFQVMPVFFIVGGYSNAASWDATVRAGTGYGAWIGARLRRLISPIVPLLLVWSAVALVAYLAGLPAEMVRIGSQAALVPVWFLAVYVMVVALVPLTRRAWQSFGMGSFWGLAVAAVAVDLLRFAGGRVDLAWVNYAFVWLAVHQMGYMWRDGRLGGPARSLPWMIGGLVVLLGLVGPAGYPRSMVGVPGDEVSNTLPPSIAMLALGALHGGLLLTLEPIARRWLRRTGVWAATILINASIMSVYLWHLTAMTLVIFLAHRAGGFGLHLEPGTGAWWATRPLWMLVLASTLGAFLPLVGRFERPPEATSSGALPAWRVIAGSVLVCIGLALVALGGVGQAAAPGLRVPVVLAALVGAALVGALPSRKKR